MTEEKSHAALGALVVEYEENERQIATLRPKLHRIGVELELLGGSLKEYLSDVQSVGSEFHIQVLGQRRTVPHEALSATSIRNLLKSWQGAIADKKRLEECLRQAGLHGLIQMSDGVTS